MPNFDLTCLDDVLELSDYELFKVAIDSQYKYEYRKFAISELYVRITEEINTDERFHT